MALPTSGQLSLSQIQLEIGGNLSNVSLRTLSGAAGFSSPDAMSEFYGYSAAAIGLEIYRIYISNSDVNYSNKTAVARMNMVTATAQENFFPDYFTITQNYRIYYSYLQYCYDYWNDYYYPCPSPTINYVQTITFTYGNTYNGLITGTTINLPSNMYSFSGGVPEGPPVLNDNGLPVQIDYWF